MGFNGKRSARERIPSQVNVDPLLSTAIRYLAERHMRPIGNEIVCMLTEAILIDPTFGCYAQFLANAQFMAPPRKVTHTRTREEVA